MKKIVVIGPESTGKSTLCKQLAAHYQTLWCPEYARQYLLQHGTQYTYNDLLTIAQGQIALEDEYTTSATQWYASKIHLPSPTFIGQHEGLAKAGETSFAPANTTNKESHRTTTPGKPLLIVDTDMYVMKVWCEFVYGACHPYILEQIAGRKYDLYLLCNIDLPWVKDDLREYPDLAIREGLHRRYKDLLENQPVPWVNIHGDYAERLQLAVGAINKVIS